MSPFLSSNVGHDNEPRQTDTKAVFPYIDAEPAVLPSSLDPFTITTQNGFMPLQTPTTDLPAAFKPLLDLADEMPIVKEDGQSGLLAKYELGAAINEKRLLPDLTDEIDDLVTADGQPDLVAVTAAFRDYSFLASAYLLEPCWERWSKGLDGYGLGREVLPACIAGPLWKTAKMLDIPPFMAYAAGYALYNWRFADASVGYDKYYNLRLIRAFERGLDPYSSEAGFILTHVDIVRHTGGLIEGSVKTMDAVAADDGSAKVADSLEVLLNTMHDIEESMEKMWAHSKPKDYISYRTFIFGITNQSMFPNGVVYEGINENKPQYFRGESGANDSIIPLLDHLLEIPMPQNPLTEILKDFRNYRPKPHREFLAYVRERAEQIGVKQYCQRDLQTKVLYLRLVEHVRSFRWRHWLFAREYIIRRSSHPTATGGSPIVTWLPNQLFAVMELMREVWESITVGERNVQGKTVNEMMDNVYESYDKLQKEVQRWCQERDPKASQAEAEALRRLEA
ncbi:Indoleamine 2,3-dioxygenase family protein [Dothistroma septosporum NZE10]|uniref:Indoleamine 2,3-dioxygenase n=1 Tax=Dothistroma septosporum (strain NZE10 / CBS 128990) TaxID=675120 RepID=M2XJ33_DOTSN|nr:Indoleamine 2,3-dioxygenase family protein [Dothistroma septosporum NZE10]